MAQGQTHTPMTTEIALREIAAGRAIGRASWILQNGDGPNPRFTRPDVWEGPGEYQAVERIDGTWAFVRIPPRGSFAISKATGGAA